MKALKSKAQERREIEHQIRFYLQQGGEVQTVENGVSGRPFGSYSATPVTFNQPREPRTLLVNEVKAIDARRSRPSPRASSSIKPKSKPRKVLITDDFGEPIRWSWKDQ
jgi:hypothetical protein